MYRLDREEFTKTPYIWLWALLAFQAGYLNAFGFLSSGRYVSHVTGIGTQIGIAAVQNSIMLVVELLGFPLFFILGSFFSGVLTISRIERGLKPLYGAVTLVLPALIFSILICGHMGVFGEFGAHYFEKLDFLLLYVFAFACGIQNGCFATLTRGQIRTTHLTGISTDLGTDMARIFFGRLSKKEKELTLRTNLSRVLTLVSFSGGSVASVWVCSYLNYAALVVPLGSSIAVFLMVTIIGSIFDRASQQAMNALQLERV